MEALILPLLSPWQISGFQTAFWLWGFLLLPFFWWHLFKSSPPADLRQLQQTNQLAIRHSLLDSYLAEKGAQPKPAGDKSLDGMVLIWLGLLRSLLFSLLLIALAQPYQTVDKPPQAPEKIQRDLVFVIESSASLMLDDYHFSGQSVSRIDAVKQVLDQFMAGMTGNRFGIVVYAEQAFSLLPLTADHRAARMSLLNLKPYLAGRTDEAMAEALGLGVEQNQRFSSVATPAVDGSRLNSDQEDRKRVVVLISDGSSEKSRLPIADAINFAKQLAVPVYTIGVGSADKSADQREFTGLIYQPLEEQSLQNIAEQTGGRYFRIGGGEQLQTVLQEIDQLEGVPVSLPLQKTSQKPLFGLFALTGLWVFVAYFVSLVVLVLWQQYRAQREARHVV